MNILEKAAISCHNSASVSFQFLLVIRKMICEAKVSKIEKIPTFGVIKALTFFWKLSKCWRTVQKLTFRIDL